MGQDIRRSTGNIRKPQTMKLKKVKAIEVINGEPVINLAADAANDDWIRAARLKREGREEELRKMENTEMHIIMEPKCFERKCKHNIRVIQPDGTEMTEQNACDAYPNGIPADIAYGDDLHLKVRPDQDNDIIYEKEKP